MDIADNTGVMDDVSLHNLPDDPAILKQMIVSMQSGFKIQLKKKVVAISAVHQVEVRQIKNNFETQFLTITSEKSQLQIQLDQEKQNRTAAIEQVKTESAAYIAILKKQHQAEIAALLKKFYGSKSERFDATQLLLFGLTMAQPAANESEVAAAVKAETGEKLSTRRIKPNKHGRQQLPPHLPRVEVIHDLTDVEKPCPCCGEIRTCIGSETSEQLEIIPALLQVFKHVRQKYACRKCGEGCDQCDSKPHIEIAIKPAQPIEKGLPGPGLLAHVIVSKLGDHLPLYRLQQIFARQDVNIARSTMCAWMHSCSDLVKPLVDLMIERVRKSSVIHTDDTRVPVQDVKVKGKCKTGRLWAYLGDDSHPYSIYDYTPDRSRDGPHKFLADYKHYLQADAYGGYDGIYRGSGNGGAIEVACWAHARRKFFDCKDSDGRRSAELLGMVQKLYKIESHIKRCIERRAGKNLSATGGETVDATGAVPAKQDNTRQQKYEIARRFRERFAKRTLDKIKTWLDAEYELVLPRSPIALAMGYLKNQWTALNRYIERGDLNIDNNAAERAMKPVALGRKNWLFAGNDAAGHSAARLYTLIESAKRHNLNPHAYLRSILANIGQTKLSDLIQFLPDVWKADLASNPPNAATQSIG